VLKDKVVGESILTRERGEHKSLEHQQDFQQLSWGRRKREKAFQKKEYHKMFH